MGKGGYHGGSTIIGPGSSWFSDTADGSVRKKKSRKKNVGVKSGSPAALPVNAATAPSLSVQAAEARRKVEVTKKSLKVCETNVRYAVRARDVVAQRLVDVEADAVRLEAQLTKQAADLRARPGGRP